MVEMIFFIFFCLIFFLKKYDRLKVYLNQVLDNESEAWISEDIATIENKYGDGMKAVPEELEYTIEGQENPINVYVLSDVTCVSSGDTFVDNVKKSPKVIVVGRATRGIMD